MNFKNEINWEEAIALLIIIAITVGFFIFVIALFAEASEIQENSRIQRIKEEDTVYYDTQTNVMYLIKENGICVMVDENGKPLLYEWSEK